MSDTPRTIRRRPVPRTTSPEWTDRDSEWAGQARAWMETQADEFFDTNAERTEYYTAADLLGYLDARPDLPVAYARFLSDYDSRYNWTVSLLDRYQRAARLEMGSTVNARGREARCYRSPRASAGYNIEVEGPDASKLHDALQQWLTSVQQQGLRVDSLLITKSNQEVNTNGTSSRNTTTGARSGRRNRSTKAATGGR